MLPMMLMVNDGWMVPSMNMMIEHFLIAFVFFIFVHFQWYVICLV